MLILADENIPLVREAFEQMGQVETYRGRELTPARLREADVLLVRSVTKVGPALLEEGHVRFVGTATIGTDHVDEDYLAEQRIGFASAPGSNANSVAEYVTAALLALAEERLPGGSCREMSIGIVGVGNVGGRVEQKARALGMNVILNDPPLARRTGDRKYRPLEEALDADVVTLHVPLTETGPDRTWHLANADSFHRMRPGAVFINTSRGPVADTGALLAALEAGKPAAAVIDVWEGEPAISTDLLRKAFIGTPHIAGYSLDGKVNGTRMLFEAVCDYFGIQATWDPAPLMPRPRNERLRPPRLEAEEAVRTAVSTAYDIRRDDAALRRIVNAAPGQRTRMFDRLRKEYPVRREFAAYRVMGGDPVTRTKLERLGFSLG